MSDNKFIKHLRGEDTAKSVLEIKNQRTTTSFANMPSGTSNANDVYLDHRGNATGVLKGAENWKLDGQNLVGTTTVYGDGRDLTSDYEASGNTLWVDATHTFAAARRFMPNTKFVLKLCGHDLETALKDTIDFTLIVKFGTSNLISKTFTVKEQAFNFCKEFVIDFAESNSSTIKVDAGSTLQIQLLCADANAQAVIYNGMTVFTALQRRVDSETVASDNKTFAEVIDDVEQLQEDLDDLEEYVDDTFVKKAGDTMSGALNIENIASSNTPLLTLTHSNTATYKWNIAPRYNSTTLSIYPGSTETNGFRFATTGFVPASNNARYLGSASLKWKGVYTAMINNGGDLVVPAVSGTLATKADVDLAANSGRMITDQGVWYAKMYAATTPPASAEVEGRNYADFSQVDRNNNPIIVIYTYTNGAWDSGTTIVPPADYDGYVPITSKIWDIPEQAGQQGGRILWNHQSKEFTPYPQIVSFDGQNITNSTFSGGTITNSTFSGTATLSGVSTVDMPQTPSANQIVNKDYVDNAIGNGTITITQSGTTKGSFTTNQNTDTTIDIDVGGTGRNIGDVFFTMRNDNELNGAVVCDGATYQTTDFAGAQSIGQLLEDGKIPFVSLTQYATLLSTNGSVGVFGWDGTNTTPFRVPSLEDIFIETGTAAQVGDYLAPALPDPNISTTIKVRTSIDGISHNYGNTGNQIVTGQAAGTFVQMSGLTTSSVTNSVYTGTTVQPNAVRYRAMVQLAVSATDEAVITCTAVTADVATMKSHEVIEFQAPIAANNYTWYRKYRDGWVEQGGIATTNGGNPTPITLPVEMADANYVPFTQGETLTDGYSGANWQVMPVNTATSTQTSTQFYAQGSITGYNLPFGWQVSGMAA